MRHCGILAHSTEGAALCFLEFCQEGVRRLGSHVYPDSPLPVLDSTRLPARAGLAVGVGDSALPAWHGGPVQ